ncbi:MAG: hypothetical protein AABZ60_04730 [Planctomycetota bacterium]
MPSVEFEENKAKDDLFAKITIKNKMATQEQIESCLNIQKKKDASGSYIPLYKVLIAKNVLDPDSAKTVLKEIKIKDSKKIEKPDSSEAEDSSKKEDKKENLSSKINEKKKGETLKREKPEATSDIPKKEKSEVKKKTERLSQKKEKKAEVDSDRHPEKLPEGTLRIGRELMTNYKIKFDCSCGKVQALSHKFIGKTGTCTACKKQIPVPHPDEKAVLCLVCDCGKDFDKNSAGCTFCGFRKPPTPPGGGQVDLMKQMEVAEKAEKKAKAEGKEIKPLLEIKTKAKANRFINHSENKPKKNPIFVYLKIFLPILVIGFAGLTYYYFTSAQPLPSKPQEGVITEVQREQNVDATKQAIELAKKEQKAVIREKEIKTEAFQKESIIEEAIKCFPSNLTRLDQLLQEGRDLDKKYPYTGDMLRFRLAIMYKLYSFEDTQDKAEQKMNAQEKKVLFENRLKKLEDMLSTIEECQTAYRYLPEGEKPRFKIPADIKIPDNNLSREYKEAKDINRDLNYFSELLERKKADCLDRIKKTDAFDFGEN